MNAQRRFALVLLALALGGFLAGCAKRPALTQASAPAPQAVVTAPPPAPAVPPPAPAPAPTPEPPVAAPPAPPPAAPPPPPVRFAENPALADIHFDYDNAAIRPGDARILDASARWLKDNPQASLLIEGHCDERGTNEYNLALGERRAVAALRYLESRGVESQRMSIISYGEERPSCRERTGACWARNRRAHFLTRSE